MSSLNVLFIFDIYLQLQGGAQNGPLENGASSQWKISNWVKGSKAEHLEDASRLSAAGGSTAGSAPTSAQQSPARSASSAAANKGLNLLDDVVCVSCFNKIPYVTHEVLLAVWLYHLQLLVSFSHNTPRNGFHAFSFHFSVFSPQFLDANCQQERVETVK